MHDLIRKILGFKTADQKYNQYFLAKSQLMDLENQLNELSREFTVKNELQKSICSTNVYETEVKNRVREKFAIFLKSYSEQLSNVLDQKIILENRCQELEKDPALVFNDLKKAMLAGQIAPEMFLQIQLNIEKAKNPKNKVAQVMREYESGQLKSSSGDKVTDRDQAIAIAMSEAGIKKGDIDKADPCWAGHEMIGMKKKDGKEVPNCVKKSEHEEGDDQSKVKEMALTKGEHKEEKHYPGETKKEYEAHEKKESPEREKKEHEAGGYEEKPAQSKAEFQRKEKQFEQKNPELKKAEGISEQHLKEMVVEHERLIPLLDKYKDDPAIANELATQKKELAHYSGMLSKAEYYHPKDATVVDNDVKEESRDFLDKGYQLTGYNINKSHEIDQLDFEFVGDTDVEKADYGGKDVTLGKPMAGDVKKYKVYVKNDKGNVVKVNFGDPNMEIKRDDPERRRSFRARHKCDQQKDRTTPGYWSCKMWSKTPVSQMTKAMECIELARAGGEIDEFEYNSWIQKAKAGTYADNEMNRRLGRVGQKYGKADDDDEEEKDDRQQGRVPKDDDGKEGNGEARPLVGREPKEEDEKIKVPKIDGLDHKKPKIKKLLDQARKASKKNLEAAVNQSDDPELRKVAQQELERRKVEENAVA